MKTQILLSLTLFLTLPSTNGQILYTDLEPDIHLTNRPFGTDETAAMDLDQDGVTDFTIHCETYFQFVHQQCCWNTNNRVQINPTEIAFARDNSASMAYCGLMACDSSVWIDSDLYFPTYSTEAPFYREGNVAQCGYSLDTLPHIYPFRKTTDSDTLYGWIRVSVRSIKMKIHDAAINLTSNVGLFAGQTVTGISEFPQIGLELFPNPFDNELTVRAMNNDRTELNLYDITGKMLLQKKFSTSVTIATEQLDQGIYICEVRNSNGTFTKRKVFKR